MRMYWEIEWIKLMVMLAAFMMHQRVVRGNCNYGNKLFLHFSYLLKNIYLFFISQIVCLHPQNIWGNSPGVVGIFSIFFFFMFYIFFFMKLKNSIWFPTVRGYIPFNNSSLRKINQHRVILNYNVHVYFRRRPPTKSQSQAHQQKPA